MSKKCGLKTEVYTRVCGYIRPVKYWNKGKKEEFKDRRTYETKNAIQRRPDISEERNESTEST